jgi:hypothetical protein
MDYVLLIICLLEIYDNYTLRKKVQDLETKLWMKETYENFN